MSSFDTAGNNAQVNAELYHSFFRAGSENLLTDKSSLVTFDNETKEIKRTIKATQVVDCIVIALWGITKEGKSFISLVHKSGRSYVEQLITEFKTQIEGAQLSYLVIPGSESGDSSIKRTKEECEKLFSKNEKSDLVPELSIIKHNNRYDKSSVAIRGTQNNVPPQILVVRPNVGDLPY